MLKRLEPRKGYAIQSVAFNSDGSLLAAGGDNHHIWIWDVDTYEEISISPILEENWISTLRFTVDNKYLISATGNGISYWDLNTGKIFGESLDDHKNWIYDIDLSRDGKFIASASADKSIILWNVQNQHPISEPLLSNMFGVWALQFSPDENMLACTSENGIALLDLETRNVIGVLNANNISPEALSFSPDGKSLAAGDYTGKIIIWDIDKDRWMENACKIVNRNFTQTEWNRYFPNEEYRITCPQYPPRQ